MEDQDRDFIAHIKERLQSRRRNAMLRAEKALSDRDILGKGLTQFWNDFRRAMGELCERLSRELNISLPCRWNGEELNVMRSSAKFTLNAKMGNAPPYEIVISGKDGLRYDATVRIVLEDSQIDWIAIENEAPTSARKVAAESLEKFLLAGDL